MNKIYHTVIPIVGIAVFVTTFLIGCAAIHHEEEEGGISGTGNTVDCTMAKLKDKKYCKN